MSAPTTPSKRKFRPIHQLIQIRKNHLLQDSIEHGENIANTRMTGRKFKPLPRTIEAGSNRIASIQHSANVKPVRFDWFRKWRKNHKEYSKKEANF